MTYHHGNLKEALVAAASDMVASGGVEEMSLRGVARQAGVSQTAPYRHFADKDELLSAVATEGFTRLARAMQGSLEGVSCSRERLASIGLSYLRFARSNPHLYRLMFGPLMVKSDSDYPKLELGCTEAFGLLVSVISEGQAKGTFRQGKPENMSFAAWSMVHGYTHLAIDGIVKTRLDDGVVETTLGNSDEESFWLEVREFLIEGLKPR